MSRLALLSIALISLMNQQVMAAPSSFQKLAPQNDVVNSSKMFPFTLREIVTYDSRQMAEKVNKSMNMKEADDEVYFTQATKALAGLALVHPRFTEREAALREIKGKLEPEDYTVIVRRATNTLLDLMKSATIAEQAIIMVALTNMVVEIRSLKRPELKDSLQKIADADLKISEDISKYAREPLLNKLIISPSAEAKAALAAL